MINFLQFVGGLFIVIGCFLISIGLGISVLGVLIVLLGLVAESNERRHVDGDT